MESCDNHKRKTAEEFLCSYRDALAVYEYLLAEEEMLRARAENIKSGSLIPAGWTGRYVTETIQGKKPTGGNDKKKTVQAKEMVPLPGRSSGDDSQEFALIALVEHSAKLEQSKQKVIKAKNDIDIVVSTALPLEDALIIKRRYILGQSINEISAAMYCSPTTIRRKLRLAIDYLDSSLFALAMTENG